LLAGWRVLTEMLKRAYNQYKQCSMQLSRAWRDGIVAPTPRMLVAYSNGRTTGELHDCNL